MIDFKEKSLFCLSLVSVLLWLLGSDLKETSHDIPPWFPLPPNSATLKTHRLLGDRSELQQALSWCETGWDGRPVGKQKLEVS